MSAANCDYNAGWNAGGNQAIANYYDSVQYPGIWSSGAGGAHDVADHDPQFVDSTRNILTWDKSLGGPNPGTSADAINLLKLTAIVDGSGNLPSGFSGTPNASATIANLVTYVKTGFQVRNPSLNNSGHDGKTIGAEDYVSSDASVTSSTYTVSALSAAPAQSPMFHTEHRRPRSWLP